MNGGQRGTCQAQYNITSKVRRFGVPYNLLVSTYLRPGYHAIAYHPIPWHYPQHTLHTRQTIHTIHTIPNSISYHTIQAESRSNPRACILYPGDLRFKTKWCLFILDYSPPNLVLLTVTTSQPWLLGIQSRTTSDYSHPRSPTLSLPLSIINPRNSVLPRPFHRYPGAVLSKNGSRNGTSMVLTYLVL